MIEVVLDFKNIKTEEELLLYTREKLGLPYKNRVGKRDSFSDNFTGLFYPEIPKDYKFSLNDEWGWSDYNDYLIYKQTDEEIGHKNKEGVRDDLKIILINFYDFYHKNSSIVQKFIEVMLSTYSSIKNNRWNDPVLGFGLDIQS